MQQNQVNFLNSRIDAPIQNFVNRTFEIIKVLGQGGEGTVYLCKSINWGVNDQKQFALKCQNQSKAEEVQFIDNLILYQNQYENLINKGKSNYQPSGLIRIYDRFKSNNKDFIVMELGELDLYTYINQQQQQNLTFDQKLNILIQLNQYHIYINQTQFIEILNLKTLLKLQINLNLLILDQQNRIQPFKNNQSRNSSLLGSRILEQQKIDDYTFLIRKKKVETRINHIIIIHLKLRKLIKNQQQIKNKKMEFQQKINKIESKFQNQIYHILKEKMMLQFFNLRIKQANWKQNQKEIIVLTKNQVQDQDQEYQKINSANENSFFQTLDQEDKTSQQEHFIIGDGLKVNVEQKEFQPQNNYEANQNQFKTILSKLQPNFKKFQITAKLIANK